MHSWFPVKTLLKPNMTKQNTNTSQSNKESVKMNFSESSSRKSKQWRDNSTESPSHSRRGVRPGSSARSSARAAAAPSQGHSNAGHSPNNAGTSSPASPRSSRRNGSTSASASSARRQADPPPSSQEQQRQQQPTATPNLTSTNPYEILGVPPDATTVQIKSSYRKLALRYHPDKLPPDASEEEKEMSNKHFAAIGNAYEILGCEEQRREFDEELLRRKMDEEAGGYAGAGGRGAAFHGNSSTRQRHSRFAGRDFFDDVFDGDFFGFHHDPFSIFERFFAEEMGSLGDVHGRHRQSQQRQGASRQRSMFGGGFFDDDPFSDPFFSGMGMGMGMGMGFGSSIGGGHSQMMSRHFNMMNPMMNQTQGGMFGGSGFLQQQQQQQQQQQEEDEWSSQETETQWS